MENDDLIYKIAMDIDALIAGNNISLLLASTAILSLLTFKTKDSPEVISPTQHIALMSITKELYQKLEQ